MPEAAVVGIGDPLDGICLLPEAAVVGIGDPLEGICLLPEAAVVGIGDGELSCSAITAFKSAIKANRASIILKFIFKLLDLV